MFCFANSMFLFFNNFTFASCFVDALRALMRMVNTAGNAENRVLPPKCLVSS